MVESLLKSKETAPKYSSKKEYFFGETTKERKERTNKFINDLKSLVKLPDNFLKANKNTKTKIAERGLIQIEEVLGNLKEDEGKELKKEEKKSVFVVLKKKIMKCYIFIYIIF